MIRRIWRLTAVLGATAGLAFGAVTLAQAGGTAHKASTESTTESTAPENSAQDRDNVQYTAPGDRDSRAVKAAAARAHRKAAPARKHRRGATRSRRARSAQPAPDPQGEQESSVESEQGQPGEPPAGKGHQDLTPQGQADPAAQHECTGNCVE